MSYNLNIDEFNNLSEQQKKIALQILNQYKNQGKSKLYDDLLYSDYDQIPVDVETFLHDKKYLGKGLTDEQGKFTLFPYWQELLKKIFPNPLQPAKYNTLALTGAIGIGKSTQAVLCVIYELYRMLCLKDPYLHYGLMPTDLITFAVMNITKDAARGVAWDKLQSLIQSSQWFMSKGTVTKSEKPQWKPPKGIELIYGSLSRHIIGRAVYSCLDGQTEIVTCDGTFKIKDLAYKNKNVISINDDKKSQVSNSCSIIPTKMSSQQIQLELQDGSIIKCTPQHRFMLKDGSYKQARFLTENDQLFEINNF